MLPAQFTQGLKPVSQAYLRLDSQNVKKAVQFRMENNRKYLDSIAPANGMHLARDLEYTFQELLREQYAPLSGLEHFPKDSRVPEGANTYRIKRISHQGDARWHRGNNYDQPRSGASMEEEIRPVRHIVASIGLDFFEEQASRFAGTNLRGELREGAMRAIQEFLNEKIWEGDEDVDVYGVLSYPYVPKHSSSVTIDDSNTGDDIVDELLRLSDLNDELSETVFRPDTMALPVAQYNYVARTLRNPSSGSDETILSHFLKKSQSITKVIKVPELKAKGPSAEDVILFFKRNDQRSVSLVVPTEIKMLPIQEVDFDIRIPLYMSYGGVMMRDPLNNLVVYTPAV